MPATDSHDGQIQGAKRPPAASARPRSSAEADDPDLFKPGDLVGGSYQILDRLGRGAMGLVYKVKHISMESEYALKVLSTEQLNDNAVMRFQNEAQALAKLNHQNLIGIYNFGLHDGRLPFYVMDLLYGDNLLDKLEAHGPMPVRLALPVFIEVCAGLSYAHRKGILHRDVKPANFVILDAPDVRGARVKVVDFGLVKFAEELKPDLQKLTAMGEVCGSPSYMSPEQSSGQKIDPRSDIYSLGCSLFQALTGKLPFRGRNATETMMMQHEVAVPTLASQGDGRSYPEALEQLVAKMMAKAPMDRYQSMESVAQDLKNVLEGKRLGTPQALPFSPASGQGNLDSSLGLTKPAQSDASAATPDVSASQRAQAMRRDSITGPLKASAERVNSERTIIQRAQTDDTFKSALGDEDSENEPPAGSIVAQVLAVIVLTIGLVGVIAFFAWQALKPVAQVPVTKALPGLDMDSTKPVELTKEPYFSKTLTVDGKEYIEFDFPEGGGEDGLGTIGMSFHDYHPIKGKVRFPKGVLLYLAPAPKAKKVPQFFEKFRRGEIAGIYMNPMLEVRDELFICAAKIPGIHRVFMGQCPDLTASIIPSLSNLKLTTFMASGTSIDGGLLARVHFWHDLRFLDLSACNNLSPILKQLSGSTNLEMLNLSGTRLNPTNYEMIANLPDLDYLNLAGNEITAEDLRSLSRLPKLSSLDVTYVRWDDVSLAAELRHFPALKTLHIVTGAMPAKDLQLLKRQCPKLKVEEAEDRRNPMRSQFMRHGGGFGRHTMSPSIHDGPGFGGRRMPPSMHEDFDDRNSMMWRSMQQSDGSAMQIKSPMGQEGDGRGEHMKSPLGNQGGPD